MRWPVALVNRNEAILVGRFRDTVFLGVSKNNGTPKWMVYNGKPY